MRGQQGVSLSGFMMWMVVLAVAALISFKIGPPYVEYLSIKKNMQAVANDPEATQGQRRQVEAAFERRALIDDIKSLTSKDLTITKDGDRVAISADYSVCVPFVANIRACMDFSPTSEK